MNIAELLQPLTNAQLTTLNEAFSNEALAKTLGDAMRQAEAELRLQLCLQAEMATQGKQVDSIIYEVYGAEIKTLASLAAVPAQIKEMKKQRGKKREEL